MNTKKSIPWGTLLVAALPTYVSFQGMNSVFLDSLHWSPTISAIFAGFVEAALIWFAWTARRISLDGGSARSSFGITWALSCITGGISALHEFVAPDGSFEATFSDVPAVAIRIIAPLLACLMWHQLIVKESSAQEPTLSDRRQDRLAQAVAIAALTVRQTAGTEMENVARNYLQKKHQRYLSVFMRKDPGQEWLSHWLSATGVVDFLPARTEIEDPELQKQAEVEAEKEKVQATLHEIQSEEEDREADKLLTKEQLTERKEILTDLVRRNPTATRSNVAQVLAAHGFATPSTRHCTRLLEQAKILLAEEIVAAL